MCCYLLYFCYSIGTAHNIKVGRDKYTNNKITGFRICHCHYLTLMLLCLCQCGILYIIPLWFRIFMFINILVIMGIYPQLCSSWYAVGVVFQKKFDWDQYSKRLSSTRGDFHKRNWRNCWRNKLGEKLWILGYCRVVSAVLGSLDSPWC